jgi:hypothetical protein
MAIQKCTWRLSCCMARKHLEWMGSWST